MKKTLGGPGRVLPGLLAALCLAWSGPLPRASAGDFTATPAAGIENGGLVWGGNLRAFPFPNLAGEFDGGFAGSTCQDCSLSEVTLTANLVYAIHPSRRLTFFVAAGGGVGLFDLTRPDSGRGTLPLADVGGGVTFRLGKSLGLTLEDRWFIPLSGPLPGVESGNLTADRWLLGLTTFF